MALDDAEPEAQDGRLLPGGDPVEQLCAVEKLGLLDYDRVVQDPEPILSHLARRQGSGGAGQYRNDGGGTKPRATQWLLVLMKSSGLSASRSSLLNIAYTQYYIAYS